jgi:glutathione S-transferase
MRHFITPRMAAFEVLLAGFEQAPYSCGEPPGFADIILMPQIYPARGGARPMRRLQGSSASKPPVSNIRQLPQHTRTADEYVTGR